MKPLHKLALVIGSMALLASTGASAYTLTGTDWSYQANPMGENWRVCTTGMPGPAGAASARTKDGGFAWNYTYFVHTFGTDACAPAAVPTLDGVNEIEYGVRPAGVLATTFWWFSGSDNVECDMEFSNAFTWYTGASASVPAGQYDWRSVAEHEFGHCVGLGHSTDPAALMYPSISSGVRKGIATDDINGRNAIYGTPCGVVAFASTRPSVLTSLPSEGWMLLPLLFLGGWKLSQKRRSS